MRTNSDIDDTLMREAQEATGLKSKKETVEHALRELIQRHQQAKLRKFRGKFQWAGDLEVMRLDEAPSETEA
jgi:Arc/MetJ family transcription regulator